MKTVEQVNAKFQDFAKRHPEWAGDYIEHVGEVYGYSYCEHCARIVSDIDLKSGDCAECANEYEARMWRVERAILRSFNQLSEESKNKWIK